MRGFRLLFTVFRHSGASKVAIWFITTYLLCALVITVVEPGVERFQDAMWFLWAVATTVGLGDVTAFTFVGRAATIICSISGIVTVAILTAVVVDYYNERRRVLLDDSVAVLLDKLEHLDELDRDELREISQRIKRICG